MSLLGQGVKGGWLRCQWAYWRRAVVASPAEAGDVEGLVEGALGPGVEGVFGLPGLGGLVGPGIGQGLVEFLRAEAEGAGAACGGRVLVLDGVGMAVGAGELNGVAAGLPGGEPAGAGADLRAAGLTELPVDAEGALLESGAGPGLR